MSPGERPAEKRRETISRARKPTTWLPGCLSGGAGPGALCTGTVWSRHLLQAHPQGLGGCLGSADAGEALCTSAGQKPAGLQLGLCSRLFAFR